MGRLQIVAKHKTTNIDMTRKLIRALRSRQWLNDEIINIYVGLLQVHPLPPSQIQNRDFLLFCSDAYHGSCICYVRFQHVSCANPYIPIIPDILHTANMRRTCGNQVVPINKVLAIAWNSDQGAYHWQAYC